MFERTRAQMQPDKANPERGPVADITDRRLAPAGAIQQISEPFQSWEGGPNQAKDRVLHLADHSIPTPQSIISGLSHDPVQEWLDRAKPTGKACPDCQEPGCIGRLETEGCENNANWREELVDIGLRYSAN